MPVLNTGQVNQRRQSVILKVVKLTKEDSL